MQRLRILVGDDHSLLLGGITSLLNPHFEVVGTVTNGRALVEEALRLKPDVVILDISMPVLNGIEAARQIGATLLNARMIFLSMHNNPMYLRKAIEAGARGYVLKTGLAEEIIDAIRAVSEGRTYFSPGFGSDALQDLWNRSGRLSRQDADLTARQREILQLIVEGRINKEIAQLLGISIKTVDFHRARLMARLGANTSAELVRIAVERGLIPSSASGEL